MKANKHHQNILIFYQNHELQYMLYLLKEFYHFSKYNLLIKYNNKSMNYMNHNQIYYLVNHIPLLLVEKLHYHKLMISNLYSYFILYLLYTILCIKSSLFFKIFNSFNHSILKILFPVFFIVFF